MSIEHNVARNSFGIGAVIVVVALMPIFMFGFSELNDLINQLITSKITSM